MSVVKASWTGVVCWTLFAAALTVAICLSLANKYHEAVLAIIIGGCLPAFNAGAWRAEELAPSKPKDVPVLSPLVHGDAMPIYLQHGSEQ